MVVRGLDASWQQGRGRLNHDWMKNQLLSALAAVLQVVGGEVEVDDLQAEMDGLDLGKWPERRAEFQRLLNTFESQMSPRVLFDRPPLSRCDSDTKSWLPETSHEIWRARYPVAQWVQDGREALDAADEAWRLLMAALSNRQKPMEEEDLPGIGPYLRDFRQACQGLARCIEQFPSRVLVG